MSEGKLRAITEAFVLPVLEGRESDVVKYPSMSNATKKGVKTTTAKLGMIEVFDSLVSKNAAFACGMASYESVSNQINAAINAGATDIGFYIDSPGGEVSGLFGLTQQIRELSAKGISTFAFTDGMATSAAYAIMAACDIAYASETSVIGSVAAIMVHMESSIGDAASGKTYTVFRSKEEKALADSHTPLTELAVTKIQTMLASMDASFNNDVSLSRPNLNIEKLLSFKGSEYMAKAALDLGLIDKIAVNMEAVLSNYFSSDNTTRGTFMAATTETQPTLAAELAAIQLSEDAVALKVKAAVEAERTNTLAILGAMATLKMKPELAVAHITKGYSSETSLEIMTAIAGATSEATAISTAAGVHATADLEAAAKLDRTNELKAAYSAATGIKL